MIVAQITDTHVKRKGKLLHHMINTAKRLRRAIDRLNALEPRPDVVLATGDLVEDGKRKEYKRLRELLDRLELPLFVVPGNHDRRDAFRDAFADRWYLPGSGPLQYAIDDYPVRLVGLDTTVDGEAGGSLDEDRLAWLDATLARAPHTPTIIFMHHPPFQTGIRALDALGFHGVEAFGALVERNAQIERIVCGHIHRAMQVRWHGTIASTAPSTAFQFELELRAGHRLGIARQTPGFALHVWQDGRIVSHDCRVDDHRSPRAVG
jgi:3',5'-cyclic-AMP phosphodiesterase